ncbi:MAG TPA: thioesterase domain-containing protein, partial [Pyrinomonadaceae bacterium]
TAHALAPFLDKPFAFFGHSMGATLAFEVARLLRDEKRQMPVHLFVSARHAPQLPDPEPPIYDLPEAELKEELRNLNGTPPEVLEHPELMELMLPLFRADCRVSETHTYRPGSPLDCSITAYGGLQDQHVRREHLEPWREHTTGAFTLRMLAGDHFFIHTSHTLLLRTLSRDLYQIVASFALQ